MSCAGIRWGAAAWCLLPCIAAAETRIIHQQGRFDPAKHDKIQKALRVALPAAVPGGRRNYEAKIQCGPFPGADWAITATLFIANPSDKKLYCHYYAAFFDDKGRLVTCCSQGTDVRPGATDFQLGSCIGHGPKSALLKATHYQLLVYESDVPVGAEPVSAKDAAGLPGKSRAVITKLTQTDADVAEQEGYTELRLSADCSFHEPEKGARNTHLRIKGAAEYDVYLSATKSERLVTRPGKSSLKLPPIWSVSAGIERLKPPKSLASRYHVALLDGKGKLVVCSASPRLFQMDAPKDRLLAARKLHVVVFEWPLTE